MATAPAAENLFDRALKRIVGAFRDVTGAAPTNAADEAASLLAACLAGRGGEVSARARAARLAQLYLAMEPPERRAFLLSLASYDADPAAVDAAMDAVRAAPDDAARAAAKAQLRRALEPPRVKLLTQFTSLPDGMKFLVDLREVLLVEVRAEPRLGPLEADLKALLAAWFDVGFLELRRIDWNSGAALLEKLVDYEAVHTIVSWRDLKNRLDSDRRCYAFFHPRMPDELLIFVEVALVKGLAGSVQQLLDLTAPLLDPAAADTAIFYSISNCQRGLDGISFGNFLIKRVVDVLGSEFRNIKQFATLSPIPGFCRWLERRLADEPALLSPDEAEALGTALAGETPQEGRAALAETLAQRTWHRDPELVAAMRPVLERLAARYLLIENAGARGAKRARDPVAHFHLSNGAKVERLNLLADTSDKGVRDGATMMVNYLYDPARIEQHHEDYVGEGKRAASTALKRLARGWS
ncbi:MAG: malonyl-CoA decarboxylase family protein [Acetobacteraceae bacterium]|nr:malonyl-CoA decarboxylase family protein [Acetobacteraceae bacterium]